MKQQPDVRVFYLINLYVHMRLFVILSGSNKDFESGIPMVCLLSWYQGHLLFDEKIYICRLIFAKIISYGAHKGHV